MLVYFLLAISLLFLMWGGDWLVKGSVGLAERLGIPPLIIGLTIVALGTSAPELVVSLNAALSGSGGLAVGNVVGSNIANVLLVLGLPALFATIACAEKGMKTNLAFLFGLTAAFMIAMSSGEIGRMQGFLLLAFLAAFLWQQFNNARNSKNEVDADYRDEVSDVPHSNRAITFFIVLGLITLPVAAHLTVGSAVEIAQRWNVSEEIIGLTIVAIGTSLPELATGISAARQGNASVSVGNVIGSNLFNIAGIMGVTATVVSVPVGAHIIGFDMWIMAASTLFLIALPVLKLRIGKLVGTGLLVFYAAYLVTTVIT